MPDQSFDAIVLFHTIKTFNAYSSLENTKILLNQNVKKLLFAKTEFEFLERGGGVVGGGEYLFNYPIPVLYFGICVYLSFAMFKNCSFFISI